MTCKVPASKLPVNPTDSSECLTIRSIIGRSKFLFPIPGAFANPDYEGIRSFSVLRENHVLVALLCKACVRKAEEVHIQRCK